MGKLHVLILGFYNRSNLGDDTFQEVLNLLLPSFNCVFQSVDDFDGVGLSKYHGLIIGCGDLLNDYFIKKLQFHLVGYRKPIIGVGLGVPHVEEITKHGQFFDRIIIRSKSDLPILSRMLGSKYVHYLPDLVFLKSGPKYQPVDRHVGVFLAQPMIVEPDYLDKVKHRIQQLIPDHQVTLYAFNTHDNPDENDLIINQIIANDIPQVIVDRNKYTSDQMISIMSRLSLAICSRFHAHVMAIIAGCPFESISNSRKVKLLLEDNHLSITETDSTKLLKVAEYNRNLLNTNQLDNLLWNQIVRPRPDDPGTESIYSDFRKMMITKNIGDPEKNTGLSEEDSQKLGIQLCYRLTGSPNSKYVWGTVNNFRKGTSLKGMIDWIQKDIAAGKLRNAPKFDLSVYKQDNECEGFHRSGWPYVNRYLKVLSDPTGVILDTFADRTFLWSRWLLEQKGIIPYTSMWVGIFHHCPDTEYTKNNSWEIVKCREFQLSLPTCQGIICLSQYLSDWYRDRLNELGYSHIPIQVLFHPTMSVETLWSPSDQIQLVNVGAWYRNPFSIYQLDLPGIQKKSLKGKEMESYFPPEDLTDLSNKWVYFMTQAYPDATNEDIQRWISSVEVIETLSNLDYDELLSKSVVFLNLVDASAANTIIECIVRNTPIVVNRHPAVVEYLGPDYPLYYSCLSEVSQLLTNKHILEAWDYLQKKDKRNLNIEYFIEHLINSPIYQNLYIEIK